jgi:hypothetical protein
MDIMKKLTDAVTDKKNPHCREGALFAFEMLCNMLGRLFEPYIVHMLPHLLLCFGDPVDYVRTAADETAKGLCLFCFNYFVITIGIILLLVQSNQQLSCLKKMPFSEKISESG